MRCAETGWLCVLICNMAAVGCSDGAKPSYERCVQLQAKGNLKEAIDACYAAIAADPMSSSATAALTKLEEIRPASTKREEDATQERSRLVASASPASAPAPAASVAGTGPSITPVPAEAEATVLVSAATFTMGSDTAGKEAHAQPATVVTISSSFTIDKFEVTAEAYQSCVTAGACTPSHIDDASIKPAALPKWQAMCNAGVPGREKNPINCVSRAQAAAYCAWRQMRLPTEAEWELAARGTDTRDYPWGNDAPTCASAKTRGCSDAARTIDVGTLAGGASPSGAYDMAGNVWEWVDDGWDAQPPSTLGSTDPHRPFTGPKGVLRGGSWDFAGSWAKTYFRLGFPAATAADATGIRCAKTQ